MKKGTKRIAGYAITAIAIYYVYRSSKQSISQGSEAMKTFLTPATNPANSGANDPSLQLYGIGNPPNWY